MPAESSIRARQAQREEDDRAVRWRYERAVARVEVVDDILAEYATWYCGRPIRRREVLPMASAVELPGVTWSIEGEVMVEFLYDDSGPSRVVVHELALLDVVKKRLRSRHVSVEYVGTGCRESG